MKRWLKPLSLSVCLVLLLSASLTHAQSAVPNDSPVNAIHITPPFEHRQDTTLATRSGDDPTPYATCFDGTRATFDHTVWYRFDSNNLAGTLQISTQGTQYNHLIAVYTIWSFGFSQEACSTTGALNLPVSPGRAYYVMVAAIGRYEAPGGQLVFAANFAAVPTITNFHLINADTNTEIQTLTPGFNYFIDLADLPTHHISIRANATSNTASMRFELDGNRWYSIESYPPFSLGGDQGGDYLPWPYTLGQHNITAVPYGQINATGTPGTPASIGVNIVYSARATHFMLVNADTDQDIMRIDNGDVIDLSDLPTRNLNIRAVFQSGKRVVSVRFSLNEQETFRVENDAPFALGGDNAGDYRPMRLAPGDYLLGVTPYLLRYGQGWPGIVEYVQFTVVE